MNKDKPTLTDFLFTVIVFMFATMLFGFCLYTGVYYGARVRPWTVNTYVR